MTHLLQDERDGFTYRVYYDDDAFYLAFIDENYRYDFDTEQDRSDAMARHERGYVAFYHVAKLRTCDCCKQLVHDKSIASVEATSPEDALEKAIKNYFN